MSFSGHKYIGHPNITEEEGHYAYLCAHCNRQVNGLVVATYFDYVKFLLCTNCGLGSVRVHYDLYPMPSFGPEIQGLPEIVGVAYKEARDCMTVKAFTACELICRKILMNISFDKGAKEKETFEFYLTYLAEKGYITPPMTKWVTLIRKHGGKATHLIEKPDKSRAESTLMFTAELLRLIYEMDYLADGYTPKPKSQP